MGFLPVDEDERSAMLRAIGAGSFADLLADIPESLRLGRPLGLPGPVSELEARACLRSLASSNASCETYACFVGGGAYDHYVPSVVDEISSRPEFYTAYTPYQPEISQGTLQTIYEFQSLIARLTGMEISNASLYDGGTALAEAVLMARAINGRSEVVVSGCVNPSKAAVLATYLKAAGTGIKMASRKGGSTDPEEIRSLVTGGTSCVVLENPNFFGGIEECAAIGQICKTSGALFVVSVDPVSLGVLAAPSEYGADIVVGEGQGLGNYLNYGGPYLGFMATHKAHIRRLPGRIVGKTLDSAGRPCFCLTLQTREQHIRREKATSNICTNEALVALRAAVYLCWLGKQGLREIGEICLSKASYAEKALASRGIRREFSGPYFKEFAVHAPVGAEGIVRALARRRLLAGLPLGRFYPELENSLLVAFTEKRTRAEIDLLAESLGDIVARQAV